MPWFDPAIGANRPGRRPGGLNRTHGDAGQMARKIVEDEAYRANLLARARDGTLQPAMEQLLWHYAYGKPVDRIESETTITHRLDDMRRMSDAELLALASGTMVEHPNGSDA